jgi:purine-nucleoside/S-methyl-5'-thioadenosine phosphorylase / adenosine deaminase
MPLTSVLLDSETSAIATLAAWDTPGLCHGFMGRGGGVSRGPYATFNLAQWVGDAPAAVRENWARWHAAYPGMRVARLAQVHGNVVQIVGDDYDAGRAQGDGMVTASPGVALGVFSADCVPILVADAARGVAGALHAGWRGTLADIASVGIRAMAALGARVNELSAALGPSIGPCCFEVDADLAGRFARTLPHARQHSRPGRPGKAYLDLRGIIREQLERAGLNPARIADIGPCTRCAADRYFSRRAAGGGVTGLQMSFIGFAR